MDQTESSRVFSEHSAEIVSDGGSVFYNPVQEFNRDLSVSVLNVFFRHLMKERRQDVGDVQKHEEIYVAGTKYDNGMRILEALAATGLRSIRYAKEIAGIREIIANDLSQSAIQSIEKNIRYNQVEHLIVPSHADAMSLMYSSTSPEKRFDAIDLDPYGCPTRFLDGAVQSIADGGLLLVTATDMAVLAGNTPEACYVKYGSVSLRTKCCHEMALRILLHSIESHANRYGKYIKPLLSISADFYIRVFVRVFHGPAKCKYSMSKQSMIYQCTGCGSYILHPMGIVKANPTEKNPHQVKFGIPTGPPVSTECEHCGHKYHLGGPIWSDAIHDHSFVDELLQEVQKEPLCNLGTQRRLLGVLSVVLEELPDVPLYYSLEKLCCVLKLEMVPALKFRSALLHDGYRVSYSHACKNSIKTDAPSTVIWDILRCWSKRHPVREDRLLKGTPVKTILEKPCTKDYQLDDIHPDANPNSRKNSLSRFQANPTPHWGPGTRATIMVGEDKLAKSFRNQNKKHKNLKRNDKTEDMEDVREIATQNQVNQSKQAKLDQ